MNAGLVALLLSALNQTVFISAVQCPLEVELVFSGFFSLHTVKVSIVGLVVIFSLAGYLISIFEQSFQQKANLNFSK
jgi:hypothetical protein